MDPVTEVPRQRFFYRGPVMGLCRLGVWGAVRPACVTRVGPQVLGFREAWRRAGTPAAAETSTPVPGIL